MSTSRYSNLRSKITSFNTPHCMSLEELWVQRTAVKLKHQVSHTGTGWNHRYIPPRTICQQSFGNVYHRKKEVYRLLSATPTDRQKRGEGFPTKNLPLVTKSALFVPKTKHNRQESPVNKLFSVRVTKHCGGRVLWHPSHKIQNVLFWRVFLGTADILQLLWDFFVLSIFFVMNIYELFSFISDNLRITETLLDRILQQHRMHIWWNIVIA